MKKTLLIGNPTFVLIMILTLVNACSNDKNPKNYLEKVLNSLEQIESATYYAKKEGWAPGDTSAFVIFYQYIKEYNNPFDSTIGASFVNLLQEDTTQMTFCYDGNMRALVYENKQIIVIDSFNVRILPFRPLSPPFFNFTKNIIKYALETVDSISMDLEDFGDSVHFKLVIFEDKQVEFFGKPHYIDNPYNFGDKISKYEIWINKSNDLPYRVRREMSHDIAVITCKNIELNKNKIDDFNASDYFPSDYTTHLYRIRNKATVKNDLVGKVAPNWVLNDADNNSFALEEFKSKVFMIEFTSVSCGPCLLSISFLKQLASEYYKKDFDFVSIESINRNSTVLKRYQDRNDFIYKFLISTKKVTKSYQIQAVPVFFILDENRVIRKIIRGYGKGTTDKEIRDAINELI
ncbi:MAG: redoxin family protein [Bacteroidales bacterium]|nr:redoxin family protein [Bacteroidales bacterium]